MIEGDGLGPIGRSARRRALSVVGGLVTMLFVNPRMIPSVLLMAMVCRLAPEKKVNEKLRWSLQAMAVDYARTEPCERDVEGVGLMLALMAGLLCRSGKLEMYRWTRQQVRRRMRFYAASDASMPWWA